MDSEEPTISDDRQPDSNLLQNLWQRSLFNSWVEINAPTKKEVHKKFILLGFLLSGGERQSFDSLNFLFEALESFQLKIPLALHVGSFVCFDTFNKIQQGPFTEAQKLQMFTVMIESFCLIHRGQIADFSIQVDQLDPSKIREVCLKSLELKSGAPVALAMRLGALAAQHPTSVQKATEFGMRFGAVMQMLDDVSSIRESACNPRSLDELKYRRPIWIWAVLAKHGTTTDWDEFRKAVGALPDTSALTDIWLNQCFRDRGLLSAGAKLKRVLRDLKTEFQLSERSEAYQLADEIVRDWIQVFS